jgi:hypothetical protein
MLKRWRAVPGSRRCLTSSPRGGGAPDFIPLYQAPAPPGSQKPDARMPTAGRASRGELQATYAVTGEQVRE